MEQWQFYQLVFNCQRDNPKWRKGQTLFNVLYNVRPDISEAIRTTANDPFFSDDVTDPRYMAAVNVIDLMWEDKNA